MATSLTQMRQQLRSPSGQKLVRYSLTSVVSVAVSVACLLFFDGVLGIQAWVSSTLATAVATVPSYYLNRQWAWGREGKSHFWREVMPFWALAFTGLVFSDLCVHLTEVFAEHHHIMHLLRTGLITVVYVAAFGVLWVVKFLVFNKLLFVHHGKDEAASTGVIG